MRLTGGASCLALALLLAGCGGGSGSGGSPAPTPTPTIAPTPTPTAASDQEIVQRTLAIDLDNPGNYAAPVLPAHYDATVAALDNTPAGEPIDDRIALLGRVLFYDRALSVDRTVSCGTCHQQAFGFGDDKRFSVGQGGVAFTSAHSMRLGNVRYSQPGTMFWNRRAATIEAQASVPILNPLEMGWQGNGGFPALIARLAALDYYPVLFRRAFGDAAIGEARIQRALAAFQRAMISSDSRWDRSYAQVFSAGAPNRNLDAALPGFGASEQRGRELFMTARDAGGAGCAACHVPPTFAHAADSRSNGLDAGQTALFKPPSLKNTARSQFWMHDGRFASLIQVVNFYDSGVRDGPALDDRLRQPGGAPQRLNLSEDDKQALVDFLETLNDEALVSAPHLADPFRR